MFLCLCLFLKTCGEIAFGRYDPDQGDQCRRYPVVIRLDSDHLFIDLPAKIKSDEKKDKEIRSIGHREYSLEGNFQK